MVLNQEVLELCWKIETLPASELQTEISVRAGKIKDKIDTLLISKEVLTGIAAQLKTELTEALEENERLRATEMAVTAYLTAKSIPAAKRAYTELWRASGLDREAYLRGE